MTTKIKSPSSNFYWPLIPMNCMAYAYANHPKLWDHFGMLGKDWTYLLEVENNGSTLQIETEKSGSQQSFQMCTCLGCGLVPNDRNESQSPAENITSCPWLGRNTSIFIEFSWFLPTKKQTPCSKGAHKVTFIQQQIPCLQVQWLPWRWSLTMGPDMMRSDPINGWLGFFPSVFFFNIVTWHIVGTLLKTNVVKLHGRHCLHASSTWMKQASMVHLI